MNKKMKTTLAMIFLFSRAIAQTTDPGVKDDKEITAIPQTYFTPILKLGSSNLNYGNRNSSAADFKKEIKGLQAGAAVQVGLAPHFSLLTEFYYMRKGGTLRINNPLTTDETTYKFNTLELPVLARLHLGRIHMNAGPSVAYILSGKEKTTDQTKAISFNKTTSGYQRLEAGVGMGGGYTFPIKQKQFTLDIRYNHGLTNISNTSEMYNRSIVVSLIGVKRPKSKPATRLGTL